MNSSDPTRIDRANIRSRPARAFTLVELLVVIVVISLLASIVAPFANSAAEQARQNACRGRLKALHDGAALYGGENRNLVPLLHESSDYGAIGKILTTGGRFAEKYLNQSKGTYSGKYARMSKEDHVFQCPSSFSTADHFSKIEATNYRLSGFGLYTGSIDDSLHPNMMTIAGTVQKSGSNYRSGQVAMAIDWIWSRKGEGLGGFKSGTSLANHRMGANVLYGSGSVKWFGYNSLLKVSSVSGFRRPPGTYGFVKGGTSGTHIFTPSGSVIPPGASGDRKPGVGIMW